MYKVENNNLVITIPLKTTRFNPYEEMGDPNYKGQEMDNVVGILGNKSSWFDIGFGFLIDMDYKGKGDQHTGILYRWEGSTDNFIQFCKENNISIIKE